MTPLDVGDNPLLLAELKQYSLDVLKDVGVADQSIDMQAAQVAQVTIRDGIREANKIVILDPFEMDLAGGCIRPERLEARDVVPDSQPSDVREHKGRVLTGSPHQWPVPSLSHAASHHSWARVGYTRQRNVTGPTTFVGHGCPVS